MIVSNFHDLLNFVHFFFLHEKFHQLSSQITYAGVRSSVPRLAWANEPTRPSRELQYSSEATGRSAPAIPRERIYSWPSQRRVEKNQEAACLCTRLATRKRNLFLLKTRELRPPAWPLAQRPAKQPARPLGKANEKSVLDFICLTK
jgi:hypothetical protein